MSLLTLDQLLQQIQIGAERRCLEFKEDIDLVNGDRKTKVDVTKDIVALANAGGGYLVMGVSERKPDRVEIIGMSDAHLERFDSTPINGFVSNYVRPAINAICRKVKIDGATLGVIEVPGLGEGRK